MFDMEYRGGNSVQIATKNKQLIVDANIAMLGLKIPKLNNVVQLATEERFMLPDDDGLVFNRPGEYEVGPFSIHGVAAQRMIDDPIAGKQSTLYRIEVGDIRIGVIGNIAPSLNDDQLEALGIVDLLVIPIGGNGYTLDATDAIKLVRRIEPSIVVPVHYAEDGVAYEVPQEAQDRFLSELSVPVEKMPKLKFKGRASLPPTLTVYALERL